MPEELSPSGHNFWANLRLLTAMPSLEESLLSDGYPRIKLPSSRTRYLFLLSEPTLNNTRFKASRHPLNLFLLLHPPKANPVSIPFEGERKRTHRSYSLKRPVRITRTVSEKYMDQEDWGLEAENSRVLTSPEEASKG